MPRKPKSTEQTVEQLSLSALGSYLGCSQTKLKQLDKNVLKHVKEQATLGLKFYKESNIQRRSSTLHRLTAIKAMCRNKDEVIDMMKNSGMMADLNLK